MKVRTTRLRKILLCGFAVTLWPLWSHARDSFSLDAYYKNFFIAFDQRQYMQPLSSSGQTIIGAVSNRLRLKCSFNPFSWLSVDSDYDFSPRIQDPWLFDNQLSWSGIDPYSYRLVDFDSRLYPPENKTVRSFGIFHNLDRAAITFKTAPADIIIGRQAIAWGSARVLNPTDVIAPFTFQELDKEDRIGVDAMRLRVPLGTLGEFDAGCIFGRKFDFKKSAFYIRTKLNVKGNDLALLFLDFRENFLAGLDIASSIGGAGVWFEGAYVSPNLMRNFPNRTDASYFRGTVGLDYSFGGKTYGFIEYHFNEAGTRNPKSYSFVLSEPAYTEGAVYLVGRHYLIPGFTYQLTPLIVLNTMAMLNLSDGSAFVMPQLEYNIAQDIYISIGAYFGMGRRPKIVMDHTSSIELRFRSEFGGYPDMYLSSLKLYF